MLVKNINKMVMTSIIYNINFNFNVRLNNNKNFI